MCSRCWKTVGRIGAAISINKWREQAKQGTSSESHCNENSISDTWDRIINKYTYQMSTIVNIGFNPKHRWLYRRISKVFLDFDSFSSFSGFNILIFFCFFQFFFPLSSFFSFHFMVFPFSNFVSPLAKILDCLFSIALLWFELHHP